MRIESDQILRGHRAPVAGIVSLDGRLFSWSQDDELEDGAVRIWEAASGALLGELDYPNLFPSGAIVADPARVLSWDALGQLRLYDTQAAELVAAHHHEDTGAIKGAAALLDDQFVCWGANGLRTFGRTDLELIDKLDAPPCDKELYGDESGLLLGSGGTLMAVDLQRLQVLWTNDEMPLEAHRDAKGRYVVITLFGELLVLQPDTGTVEARRDGDGTALDGLVSTGAGRWVAWCGLHRPRLFAFDEDDWQLELESEDQHGAETDTGFVPEAIAGIHVLASGRLLTWDNSTQPQMCWWDSARGRRIKGIALPTAGRDQTTVRVDSRGTRAIVYSDRADVRIYDLTTGEEAGVLDGHQGRVRGVIELGDGRLATWSDDATVRIWPLAEL